MPNTKVDFADNDGGGAGSGLLSRDLSPSPAASLNPSLSTSPECRTRDRQLNSQRPLENSFPFALTTLLIVGRAMIKCVPR